MIRLQDLYFSYGGNIPALQDIQLDIRPGERLAVIGPNGSGKSTLARCLNGLCRPQEGRVAVDDLSTDDDEALFSIRQRVGMVFQNPDDQLVATSVEAEIAFGLENIALPPAEMHRRVDETLCAFHLETYRHHPPHHLSGGEKQRLAVAAAVALRPRYLVLDEPTSLLDPQSRTEVDHLLERLQEDFGITTIYITQNLAEAARSERIVVLHQGKVYCDNTPAEVFADVDGLRAIGLDLPFADAVAEQLRRLRQWPLPSPVHVDQLAECLASLLPRRQLRADRPPPPDTAPGKIAADHLHYTYDPGMPHQHIGLDEVVADIPAGSITALLGPSGSGKTTLAQHFNGLLKPQRGRVLLDGEDIWTQAMTRVRQRVGLVFQFPELQLFEETVADDVAFGPRNLGFAPEEVERLSRRALEAVGLPWNAFHRRSPLALSGGEKRRVALAGVLAMDPEVLILDEPTAGLDPRASATLAAIFRRLREEGTTLVLIAHDMDLVAELATHVIVLQKGRILLQGSTRAVFARPDFATASGLVPPAAMQLMRGLEARGCQVPTDLLTRAEVLNFLTAV